MRQRQENRLPFWCETKILAGCRQSNKKGTDGLWFNPCVPFYSPFIPLLLWSCGQRKKISAKRVDECPYMDSSVHR